MNEGLMEITLTVPLKISDLPMYAANTKKEIVRTSIWKKKYLNWKLLFLIN